MDLGLMNQLVWPKKKLDFEKKVKILNETLTTSDNSVKNKIKIIKKFLLDSKHLQRQKKNQRSRRSQEQGSKLHD